MVSLKHHAKVLLVDEFENDKHRPGILELFRVTSRGGKKIRGTHDHQGVAFTLKIMPWFAAMEMGLKKQADRNRFIILDTKDIPSDVFGKVSLPTNDRLRDLGIRLLAVGLQHIHKARAFVLDLKGCQVENVPGRCVEQFAVPCGMLSAIHGHNRAMAEAFMRDWLAAWDFSAQAVRDDVNVLQEILTSEVILDRGVRTTVSALLNSPYAGETKAALARVGIRRVTSRKQRKEVLFLWPSTINRQLLKGSVFQDQMIDQYLLRLDGAKSKVQQRMDKMGSPYGITIPMTTINAFLGEPDDDIDDEAENERE